MLRIWVTSRFFHPTLQCVTCIHFSGEQINLGMLEKCAAAIRSHNAAHGCSIPADLKALMPGSVGHHAEAALPGYREFLQSLGLQPADIPDYPKACWVFFHLLLILKKSGQVMSVWQDVWIPSEITCVLKW